MIIFRHKINRKLYFIERLVLDIHKLNANAHAGIYATPYNWTGDTIQYHSEDKDMCNRFLNYNFIKAYEI